MNLFNQDPEITSYVVIVLEAGGFMPKLIVEERSRLGPEVYKRCPQKLEPFQSYRLAKTEARHWARYLGVPVRGWA